MERICKMLKVGSHPPCKHPPTKYSEYCRAHAFRMKNNISKLKPCIICSKGTYAKYQVCNPCGVPKLDARPYDKEARIMRKILI